MIKINLLPVKEKKRRQQILIILYISLVLLVVAAVLGWVLTLKFRERSVVKDEIARIDEESAGYQEKIREIKELEASQSKLAEFQKIAQAIGNDQKKLLGSLDLLAEQMPADVWLSDLAQGKDKDENLLTIRGYSFSLTALETYVKNLGRPSAFLTDPVLTIQNAGAARGQNRVYQFEIKTMMVAPK